MTTRREFIKLGGATSAAILMARMRVMRALAAPAAAGLSDPALQPKFMNPVPDAMAPTFKYSPNGNTNKYKVAVGPSVQMTGLVGPDGITPVPTPVFGYGDPAGGYTWPGKTFEPLR